MSELKEQIEGLIGQAKNRKVRDFKASAEALINTKVHEKVGEIKADVAKDFLKQSSVNESYEGKNMMDGLARIVDMDGKGYPAMDGQVMTLDNGDEVVVDAESAQKLLDFIRLHDEKEQFDIQRKLRKSKMEFLDVCAACAAPIAQAN